MLLADIASTGFGGAEAAPVRLGDAVVIFAQGPIGLCATAGAKLMGAALIIGVDGDEHRLEMARQMGADVVLNYQEVDVVSEVQRLTGGGSMSRSRRSARSRRSRMPCAACVRAAHSSLGVYAGKLQVPYDAFAAGLGDHHIVTTLCPGGKERMRRLLSLVQSGRFDPAPLLTHTFALKDITEGYRLFGERLDKVMKVAIRPCYRGLCSNGTKNWEVDASRPVHRDYAVDANHPERHDPNGYRATRIVTGSRGLPSRVD